MTSRPDLTKKVDQVYQWIDCEITKNNNTGTCLACGRCCDFEDYDHKLFVTSPEIEYLANTLGTNNIKQMIDSLCPYNMDKKCSIYEYRFAGCRIFNCNADTDFQSRLSEAALKKFKSLCLEFEIPYRYTDLKTALNGNAVSS